MVVQQHRLLPLFTIIILLLLNNVAAFSYRDITAKKYQEHIINSAIDYPSNHDEDHLPSLLPSLFFDARRSIFNRRYCCLVLRASSDDGDKGGRKQKGSGYRFGDITKSLIGGSVEKVTWVVCYNVAVYYIITHVYAFVWSNNSCYVIRLLANHTNLEVRKTEANYAFAF